MSERAPEIASERTAEEADLRAYVLDELQRALGWELTFLVRTDGEDVTLVATAGDADPLGDGPGATACLRAVCGLTPAGPDATAAVRPECAALGIESVARHVVRRRDGSVYGVLGAVDRQRRVPRQDALRLGEAFARLLSWELERVALQEQLASLAEIDALTGLVNRHVFYQRLGAEVERAQTQGAPLALVLLDLDNFRHVNESRGHSVGDRVLREAAGRLTGLVEHGDVLARVGGQEFAWLLPGRDAQAAYRAAERARVALASATLADGVELTVSAGVADMADSGVLGEMHRRADRALARAKENGGDLSVRYTREEIETAPSPERLEQRARSQTAAALRALARAVDAKDPSTQRHSERVAGLAARLAAELGWSPDRASALREAGLVHDVGKTGVPDAILFKPDRLTESEYQQVRRHAALGAQIVADVLTPEQVDWVRHHHERFDGRGYPDLLAGDAISQGARILALADAWDAMVNVRVYRGSMDPAEALAECVRQSGSQFCPDAVAALERLSLSGLLDPTNPEARPD